MASRLVRREWVVFGVDLAVGTSKTAVFDVPPGASVAGATLPAGSMTAEQIAEAINLDPKSPFLAVVRRGVVLNPRCSPPRTAGLRKVG